MHSYSSLAVRLLLLALIALSISLFWLRFRRVLGRILRAKRDSDFTLGSIGRRTWEFIWEVMCQAKVIRERPLPGIAHAFVFWGFCAFGLITINHIVVGFGGRILSPDSGFGKFYFGFVAVWAAAVAISIAGLFVRRFMVRPKWLGEVSPESGFIAFLIFLLMVTYLAGLRYPEPSLAGRVSWWLHTLALLTFL